MLTRDGHKVILEKIEDWNVVELMVNEEIVFHCNIQDLEFGRSFSTAPSQYFAFPEACLISSASGQWLYPDSSWFFFCVLNSYSKRCILCYVYEHILKDTEISALCPGLLPRILET